MHTFISTICRWCDISVILALSLKITVRIAFNDQIRNDMTWHSQVTVCIYSVLYFKVSLSPFILQVLYNIAIPENNLGLIQNYELRKELHR